MKPTTIQTSSAGCTACGASICRLRRSGGVVISRCFPTQRDMTTASSVEDLLTLACACRRRRERLSIERERVDVELNRRVWPRTPD